MSEQARTEEPTPRRLREARRRGQVARSRDLTAAVSIAAAIAAIALFVVPMLASMGAAAAGTLRTVGGAGPEAVGIDLGRYASIALRLSTPLLLLPLVAVLAAGIAQVGGLFAMDAVTPKLERVDPGRGLARIFGARGWFEAAKAVLKFAIVAGAAALAARGSLREFVRACAVDSPTVASALADLLLRLGCSACAALLVLGAADVGWQRWRHRRDLRMTREEVRREHREEEGDPAVKAERLRLHREVLAHRMVMDVPRATCVIVNPTHVAIALRYDADDEDAAPVVLAKGEGDLAKRIVAAARAAGVPVLRNAPVARELLACELGGAIPERLYEAVAEVMRVLLREARE